MPFTSMLMRCLYPAKDNFQKPCACGCGQLIWNRNRNGILLYKVHHCRRGLWWFDGKPHTTLGKKRPDASIRMKEHNPAAKLEVKLHALHRRIKQRLPKPKLCQCCNKRAAHDLANISGKYLEDLSDWEWQCRRCHMHIDGRMNNLFYGNRRQMGVVKFGAKQRTSAPVLTNLSTNIPL